MSVKSRIGRPAAELPESALLVASKQLLDLTKALSLIGDVFVHVEPVRESARSGRILLQEPSGRSVALSGRHTPLRAATELIRMTTESEARYDPARMPDTAYEKGWEIRRAEIDGVPAAIALAAWVPKVS